MKELMSNRGFTLMTLIMKIMETVHPHARKRAETFGISKGSTVIDYACGPGRYTIEFAKLAGEHGRIFAVDLKDLALKEVEKKAKSQGLTNIQLRLAKGYDSSIESEIADMVIVLDVFFMIENPSLFLKEINRICKKDGILVIDDGHQSRKATIKKIKDSGLWEIIEERKDHLKCKKSYN